MRGSGQPDVAMPPPDAGDDALGIQFGVSVPLWFDKNVSRTRQALADAEKARAFRVERVNQSRTQISTLFFRLRNAERLMTLYGKEMIPQAMASMETAETWFREGQGSFSDFVEIQSTAYNFQLSPGACPGGLRQGSGRTRAPRGVGLDRAGDGHGKGGETMKTIMGTRLFSAAAPRGWRLRQQLSWDDVRTGCLPAAALF